MSDDINLNSVDGGFDFDGLEAGVTRPKNDRKAIPIVMTSALEGFKSRVTDTGFIGNVLKDSLPTGYSSTLDAADQLSTELSSAVENVERFIRPGLDEFKSAVRSQMPRIRRYLPESLSDKLEEKLKVVEVPRGPSKEEIQESAVVSSLQGFMQAQAEYQDTQVGRTMLRDSIEGNKVEFRHESAMRQAQLLQQGVSRLVSYQDSITSQYQQRMLMINQRQYITIRDLLDVSKAGFVDLISQLQAVAKNTALPEEAKLLLTENYSQEVKSRLAGRVADYTGSKIGKIRSKTILNLKNKIGEVANNFSEGLSQGAGAIDGLGMVADIEEMTGQKRSIKEKIADFAGGGIANKIGAKVSSLTNRFVGDGDPIDVSEGGGKPNVINILGAKISNMGAGVEGEDAKPNLASVVGDKVSKFGDKLDSEGVGLRRSFSNKLGAKVSKLGTKVLGEDNRIMDFNNKLLFAMNNKDELINQFGRGRSDNYDVISVLTDTLRDLVNTVRSDEGSVLQNLQDDAIVAVPFDILTRRSIVEIIPGYLSRMLQQMEISNSGDKNTDRLTYSAQSEAFERLGKVSKDVREAIRPESARESLAVRTKDVLDKLDSEGTLSPEARKAFGVQILKDLSDGRGFFPERYADYDTFTAVKDESEINEIREFINKRYQINEKGKIGKGVEISKRAVEDNRAVKGLTSSLPEIQTTLNKFVATANKDQLRAAGVIRKGSDGIRDEVNSEFIWDTIASDLDNAIAGKEIKSETTETDFTIDTDSKLPPEKLQRNVSNVASVISKVTDAQLPDSILKSIYSTLELGNSLTTSMIARMDTWANRGIDEETMEDVPEAYIPYLEEIKLRAGTSDETLNEIKALLVGIAAGVVKGDGDSSGLSANKGPGILGKSFGLANTAVKGTASALGSYYKGVFSLGGTAIKSATSLAKGVTTGGFNMLKGKTKDLTGDLYIKGQQLPSLYGAKLKAGRYADAVTGDVIESIDDIKGAVKDIDTGQVVLSAEDATKGFSDAKGKSLALKGLKMLATAPIKYLQAYYSTLWSGTKFASRMVSKGLGFITDRGKKLKDVYVRGEPAPRLLKILLERGEYSSAKTGKVLTALDDIDGDILNSKGEVVLSVDDMKKGLVDVYGRKLEFKSILDNILGFGKSAIVGGLKLTKKLAVGYKNLLFGGKDAEGNEIKSIFGKFAGLLSGLMPSFGGGDGGFGNAKYAKEVIINAELAKVYGPYKTGDDDGGPFGRGPSSPTGGPSDTIIPPVGGFGNKPSSLKDVMKSDFLSTRTAQLKEFSQKATSKFGEFTERTKGSITGLKDNAVDKITDAQQKTSVVFTDGMVALKDASTQGQAKVSEGIDKLVNLIDDRMVKDKPTKGDSDGDGVRDGSFQDLRARAKEKAANVKQGAMEAISGPGTALIGSVTGLLGAFGKKVSSWDSPSGGDSEGDDGSLLGDLGGEVAGELGADAIQDRLGNKEERKAKRAAKRAGRAAKPKGRFGRLFAGAKGLIGSGIDKVKGAGSALKLGAMGLLGMGGATAAAGSSTATVAGSGLLSGVTGSGILGGLGRGALMLGRAALGPVGLAATAAYYGYKGAKYLADGGETEPLEKVRFAQYGIKTESSEHRRAIRRLESDMMDEVRFDNDGKASLSKVDLNDIIEEHGDAFSVNPNNRESMENFIRWYETVFKPTLLTHATLLRKADEDADLTDVDDELDDSLKAKYVQKAVELLKSSTAIGNVSPYLGEWAGSDSVTSALNQAVGTIDSKDINKPTGTAKALVAATGTAAVASNITKAKLPTTPPKTGVSQYDQYTNADVRIGDKRKSMLLGLATVGSSSNVVDMVTREPYNPDKQAMVSSPADFSIDDANIRLKAQYEASMPKEADPMATTDRAVDEIRRRNLDKATLITQQQQYMDTVSNEQLKVVSGLLKESLATQRSMDSSLKDIRGLLAEGKLAAEAKVPAQERPKADTAKLEGFRQQLQRNTKRGKGPASPVVDMKKRA